MASEEVSTKSPFESLKSEKFIQLTTFRKSGVGVGTPVWFAFDPQNDQRLYVNTPTTSGKIKRLKNNDRVLLAACTQRGQVHGPEIEARCHVVPESEHVQVNKIMAKQFGFLYFVFGIIGKISRSQRTFLVIEA
ncbi:PPOX class F420-dependent oxidoreductase [Tengunoibacter tsumagoiensis]|uniref:PPOX class F420-dependent oxidoreductase n=1 Tax=Tengunoibacter tsumagoiensis TaxID=2014871 RepID=A0A401ZUQ0_9CHLR|nr:PPOX class F420-dependent oxidoreductase [Tengunoibacter tsumagoiensis]GCE10516.1 PPOX class F420-dependent oxidoreductase [Tengunoibacter tsumagoiensis]